MAKCIICNNKFIQKYSSFEKHCDNNVCKKMARISFKKKIRKIKKMIKLKK